MYKIKYFFVDELTCVVDTQMTTIVGVPTLRFLNHVHGEQWKREVLGIHRFS